MALIQSIHPRSDFTDLFIQILFTYNHVDLLDQVLI